jgi:hypothetical protein
MFPLEHTFGQTSSIVSSNGSSVSGGVAVNISNGIATIRTLDGRVFQIPAPQGRVSTSSINNKTVVTVNGKVFEIPPIVESPLIADVNKTLSQVSKQISIASVHPTYENVAKATTGIDAVVGKLMTMERRLGPSPKIDSAIQSLDAAKERIAQLSTVEPISPMASVPVPPVQTIKAGFTFPETIFGVKSIYVIAGAAALFFLMRR